MLMEKFDPREEPKTVARAIQLTRNEELERNKAARVPG
jgi:hypothetical protein